MHERNFQEALLARGEVVDSYDDVALSKKPVHEVAANKASASGHDDIHTGDKAQSVKAQRSVFRKSYAAMAWRLVNCPHSVGMPAH